ncbi:hypothetical protein NDU88_001540 [Pleurodeles waltl]|uniref:Uncharacterized protein n=1 Tax=Pleurodeles waltl TaxID=8319 RepID=A0AAV7NDM6_PLEWA|nr:hypothetical protein NDU88_001540 [Pleurodeles waltl]
MENMEFYVELPLLDLLGREMGGSKIARDGSLCTRNVGVKVSLWLTVKLREVEYISDDDCNVVVLKVGAKGDVGPVAIVCIRWSNCDGEEDNFGGEVYDEEIKVCEITGGSTVAEEWIEEIKKDQALQLVKHLVSSGWTKKEDCEEVVKGFWEAREECMSSADKPDQGIDWELRVTARSVKHPFLGDTENDKDSQYYRQKRESSDEQGYEGGLRLSGT